MNDDIAIGLTVADIARNQPFLGGWAVRWDDEPFRFKFYRNCPSIALNGTIPLRFNGGFCGPTADYQGVPTSRLDRLAHLLAYLARPSRTRRLLVPGKASHEILRLDGNEIISLGPSALNLLRGVPSGGGLYPWELYLYCAATEDNDLPSGAFHYDPAHHRLDILEHPAQSQPSFSHGRGDIEICISAVYWKNYFKYGHAAIQLQALDIGVVASQLIWLTRAFGFHAEAALRFADREIDAAFGLDINAEAVHAVISLSDTDRHPSPSIWQVRSENPAETPAVVERSQHPLPCPLAKLVNMASCMDGDALLRVPHFVDAVADAAADDAMPDVADVNIAELLLQRRSGIDNFTRARLSESAFRSLLTTASQALAADVAGALRRHLGVRWAVIDAPPRQAGIYRQSPGDADLELIADGDRRTLSRWLQDSYSLQNINFDACSVVMLLFTNYTEVLNVFGNRGMRMINIEAGACVQRLCALGNALGLGVHPAYGLQNAPVRGGIPDLSLLESFILGVAFGEPLRQTSRRAMPLWT